MKDILEKRKFRVFQIKWRVSLDHSCCNFHDFERLCDAKKFVCEHGNQWKISKIEVLVPSKQAV